MKHLVLCLVVLFAVSGMFGPAKATLVSVSGPNSSAGTAPAIIAPPPHVLDDIVTNTGMQGFDEAQAVVTTVAHATDSGSIPPGTLVDSHMIFLNSEGTASLSHRGVTWMLSGIIIGVMSNTPGTLEAASTPELGNPLTNYTSTFPGSGPAAPFPNRGFEIADSYSVLGNTITVNMGVSEPGDWIRVVTLHPRGCSLGFWKNHLDAWKPTGYKPEQPVGSAFPKAALYGLAKDSLLDALEYKGGPGLSGAAQILLRNAVAALLNAAHPGVAYPLTVDQVVTVVNKALASQNRQKMLKLNAKLDACNNLFCPLGELKDESPRPAPERSNNISTLWGEIKSR